MLFKKVFSLTLFLLVFTSFTPTTVLARTYGEGLYGRDKYQEPTTTSTSGDGDKIAPVATLKIICRKKIKL
ncbi:MAG: hypothetical protein A3B44_02630 [Candidatus Levybacteria bacterium RIFCSPLOWO2_01_FULL_38_21]|nr:MAG: hypothetical protein A3B44_02630 [Candidatus Levybacteria bacterium RIFCSPLOWO2_01_FULL_38_21]